MFKNIYVIGVFDLFHKGHIELLRRAKSLGQRLIVAVNGDEMVAEYKRRPLYSEDDRLDLIKSCKYVDEAFIIREFNNREYLEKYEIDAIVHGDDWEIKSYLKQICVTPEYLVKHNIEMVLIPYTSGISTTNLIERIKGNKPHQNKSVHLPTIFQVNENIIDKIPHFLNQSKTKFRNILVVSGSTRSLSYADLILETLDAKGFIAHKNDEDTVETLKDYCLSNGIELILGVGGGSILDLVKRVSLLTEIENLLVPTIISNDGLVSPISVIKDRNNKTVSLPGRTPFGIVVDLNIIKNAPPKFLQAAAGDILSNISATNDWSLASKSNGEPTNDLAYMLSRSAAFGLLHHESKDIKNRNFLKQVVLCQINSGLSMALAGTSRPCSGSEHLISHAIDYYNFSENTLHGLQVGSISIFCLYLQRKLDAKCINYAQELNIPLAFHLLDEKLADNLSLIYETAFSMRPGRFTVLDTYKNLKFEDVYSEFLDLLERFKVYDSSYSIL